MDAVQKTLQPVKVWLVTVCRWIAGITFFAAAAHAASYDLAQDSDLVGTRDRLTLRESTPLAVVARDHDIGYQELLDANQGVSHWHPPAGAVLTLPTDHILPDGPRRGIVINLSELHLYYYPPAERGKPARVEIFSISTGRSAWETPITETKIVAKRTDPSWTPPQSIRIEYEVDGKSLPAVVPSGPDNPLGRHALLLGLPGYLIHGVNRSKELGIGMRVTHGCIRVAPANIEHLYQVVPVGTPVTIVSQPVKVGRRGRELWIEVHDPASADPPEDSLYEQAERLLEAKRGASVVLNWDELRHAVELRDGMPHLIGQLPE